MCKIELKIVKGRFEGKVGKKGFSSFSEIMIREQMSHEYNKRIEKLYRSLNPTYYLNWNADIWQKAKNEVDKSLGIVKDE